jgi:electron transport complex protein RnfD
MLRVFIALLPAALMGVYAFGGQALWTLILSTASAVLAEALAQKLLKRPVTAFHDGSAAVTGLLLGLCLPPAVPWYLAVVGSAFAVVIAKQVFGGLGSNFVNPALAGRAFLLACWPAAMTTFIGIDGQTGATPLAYLQSPTDLAAAFGENWRLDAFLGRVPGTIGEVSTLALLLGAAFLLISRIIDWRIPLSYLASLGVLSVIAGVELSASLLLGGVVLSAFFMATDYVTSPASSWGKIVFGLGCGVVNFVIRQWGAYPEGVTYAILLMNVCSPLIERATRPKKYGEVKARA